MIKKLRYYFIFFIYYMVYMICSTLLLPFFMLRPRNVANGYIYAAVVRQMSGLYSIDWRIRNSEVLGGKSGAVIICNHQSTFDALGMLHIWKLVEKMCCIAKKELLYLGPFGIGNYLMGTLFVDRKNNKKALKSLEETKHILTTQKTKIVVFPEGTRNLKQKTKLLPFKKGAFNIAVMAQVPIIPIVLSPYYFIDREKHTFDSGYIIIECLEPVPTKGLSNEDVPELTERLHGIMLAAYDRLCDEVMSTMPTKYN